MDLKSFIRQSAISAGFEYCGFARAGMLDDDARRLEQWLNKGYHGTMHYMANHFEKRVNPALLVPGAKTVITFLKNYFPETRQRADAPQVSKYAYGQDYHLVIRAQLNALLETIRTKAGPIAGRGFVDSAPVLERAWAVKSGLGWVGKNGNLLTRHAGSFFFIATLITDLELEPDAPFARDFCGSCTRCIDACPTQAILPHKTIDGSRCISYFTIELKDLVIPAEVKGNMANWMFGCDICQDVCPWNRFATPHQEPAFAAAETILEFSKSQWEALDPGTFKQLFRHSPLGRAKWQGIRRNLSFLNES